MSAADEILKRRRAELAEKFLARSHEDIVMLQARLAAASADAPLPGAADFRMSAHKIAGTGATLGLDSLSDLGRELELLLSRASGSVRAPELEDLKLATLRLLSEIERLSAQP